MLAALAAGFLPHQSIWIDETTQLKGLTLSPVQVVRWLAGENRDRFGVPGDRMPPVSYWAGIAWSRAFGLTETSLRWMGVVFAALASVVISLAARQLSGPSGQWAAGLWFACSPNVISTAVEIRAYPIFLFTSACSFYAFLKIVGSPRAYGPVWAGALTFFLVLSIYTHFFGVVMAGSLWAACLLVLWIQKGRWRTALAGAVATGLSSLGLVPFVRSAFEMSTIREPGGNSVRDLIRLLYRIFGHPALGTSVIATAIAGVSVAVLLWVVFLPRKESYVSGYALAGSIALGLAITLVGGLVLKNFKAYQSNYSMWILPGFAVLISLVHSVERPLARRLGSLALIFYLASQGYAVTMLETHGTLFSHGLYGRLSVLVKESGPQRTAVIHEGEDFAIAYFPLLFGFGDDLKQYGPASAAPDKLLRLIPGSRPSNPLSVQDLEGVRLIVVRPQWLTAAELREELLHRRPPIARGPVSRVLRGSKDWRLLDSEEFAAFTGAAIDIFEKQ